MFGADDLRGSFCAKVVSRAKFYGRRSGTASPRRRGSACLIWVTRPSPLLQLLLTGFESSLRPGARACKLTVVQELMNEPMRTLRYRAVDLIKNGCLDRELQKYLDQGLVVEEGCIYLAVELAQNPHLSRDKMGALGHQSLINKLHLLDYYEDDVAVPWELWCVAQGIMFARKVLAATKMLTAMPVDVVLTLDQGGAIAPYTQQSIVSFTPDSGDLSAPSSTIRFYVRRDGHRWIDDEAINDMHDAIMIIRE
jgi:hypothetical protein